MSPLTSTRLTSDDPLTVRVVAVIPGPVADDATICGQQVPVPQAGGDDSGPAEDQSRRGSCPQPPPPPHGRRPRLDDTRLECDDTEMF